MRRAAPQPSPAARTLACGSLLTAMLACGAGITLLCAELLQRFGQPVMHPILRAFLE